VVELAGVLDVCDRRRLAGEVVDGESAVDPSRRSRVAQLAPDDGRVGQVAGRGVEPGEPAPVGQGRQQVPGVALDGRGHPVGVVDGELGVALVRRVDGHARLASGRTVGLGRPVSGGSLAAVAPVAGVGPDRVPGTRPALVVDGRVGRHGPLTPLCSRPGTLGSSQYCRE